MQHAFHISQGYYALWSSVYGADNAAAISERFAYESSHRLAPKLFPLNGTSFEFYAGLDYQYEKYIKLYANILKLK